MTDRQVSPLPPRGFSGHLRLLLRFWQASLIQAMEYRLSFTLGVLANACDFALGLLQYLLFFSAAESIAGWDLDAMLGLYAVFMMMFALHFIVLFPNLEELARLVNRGDLDLVLVKPVPPLLLLSCKRLSFEDFGSLGTATVLLGFLVATGRVMLTPGRAIAFLLALAISAIVVYAGFLLLMAVAVASERLGNVAELTWSMFSLCRYPVDIYPRLARQVMLTLIPIAFVVTVPARILSTAIDPWLLARGAALALIFLALALHLWHRALANYTSAGG